MRKGLLHKPITLFGPIVDKIMLTHFVVIGLPTVFYYYVLSGGGNLLPLHVVIPVLYFVTSIVVIGEALSTALTYSSGKLQKPKFGWIQRFLRTPRTYDSDRREVPDLQSATPRSSLVVAAYLPNEQHIILSTLKHILATLNRPKDGLE